MEALVANGSQASASEKLMENLHSGPDRIKTSFGKLLTIKIDKAKHKQSIKQEAGVIGLVFATLTFAGGAQCKLFNRRRASAKRISPKRPNRQARFKYGQNSKCSNQFEIANYTISHLFEFKSSIKFDVSQLLRDIHSIKVN